MEFKVISNYPNYAISNSGVLINTNTKRELKYWISNAGYYCCRIINEDGHKRVSIHSLVAMMFLGDKPVGHVIDHIDRDKLNNNHSNLRYATKSANSLNVNVRTQARVCRQDGNYNIHEIKKYGMITGYTVVIKQKYYGYFNTIDEAIAKRNEIISTLNI